VIEAVARLQAGAARVLAVIDDDEREGTRTVRLEHRRFQARLVILAGRNQHDVFVDAVVELQLLFDCQARQHAQAAIRTEASVRTDLRTLNMDCFWNSSGLGTKRTLIA
jgi:hypothetical protein